VAASLRDIAVDFCYNGCSIRRKMPLSDKSPLVSKSLIDAKEQKYYVKCWQHKLK
jgi:hypothetical protein